MSKSGASPHVVSSLKILRFTPSLIHSFTHSRIHSFTLLQLASSRGVFERLPGDADHLVVAFLGAAQVDILDRIVRLRHLPLAARAVDDRGLHRRDYRAPVTDVAPDLVERL